MLSENFLCLLFCNNQIGAFIKSELIQPVIVIV